MYDLVIKEFRKSGLTQADLARRLGLGTDRVCRLLGGPGNWTLDTASDLLFAISGAEPLYGLAYPLDRPASNRPLPEWLLDNGHAAKFSATSHTAYYLGTQTPVTEALQ
jgi:transcriptional regulator with XRE-family HTH domain